MDIDWITTPCFKWCRLDVIGQLVTNREYLGQSWTWYPRGPGGVFKGFLHLGGISWHECDHFPVPFSFLERWRRGTACWRVHENHTALGQERAIKTFPSHRGEPPAVCQGWGAGILAGWCPGYQACPYSIHATGRGDLQQGLARSTAGSGKVSNFAQLYR